MDSPAKSILRRIADAIDVKPEEKTEAKSVARLVKQMKDIPEAREVYKPREVARPTNAAVTSLRGKTQVFFTDGSLRNTHRRPTKEERRALKRAKRHIKRFGNVAADSREG